MADERATAGRLRLHGLCAMLLAPLAIAVAALAWWLVAPWLCDVVAYPAVVLALWVLRTLLVLCAIPMLVIFVAGAIQLIAGRPLGLVEYLYKKNKE